MNYYSRKIFDIFGDFAILVLSVDVCQLGIMKKETKKKMERKLLPLVGHTSESTAYLVNDYPYGFTLRCKIRYWVEYSPRHGYRFCSQTTNPKLSYEKWNKPKKGTYSAMMIMVQVDQPGADDHGHVSWTSLYAGAGSEKIKEFAERWSAALSPEQMKELEIMGKFSGKLEEMYRKGEIRHEITVHKPVMLSSLVTKN